MRRRNWLELKTLPINARSAYIGRPTKSVLKIVQFLKIVQKEKKGIRYPKKLSRT